MARGLRALARLGGRLRDVGDVDSARVGDVIERFYGDGAAQLDPWLAVMDGPVPGVHTLPATEEHVGPLSYSTTHRLRALPVDVARVALAEPGTVPAPVAHMLRTETVAFFDDLSVAVARAGERGEHHAMTIRFCHLASGHAELELAARLIAGGQSWPVGADDDAVLCEAGFFCVTKSGAELRLISDGSPGNALGLGTAKSAGLTMPSMTLPTLEFTDRVRVDRGALEAAGGLSFEARDIHACFHHCSFPPGLRGLYASPPMDGDRLRELLPPTCEGIADLVPSGPVRIVPTTAPMGSSFSALIVQDVTTAMVQAAGDGLDGTVNVNVATGIIDINTDQPRVAASYIDDLFGMGIGRYTMSALGENMDDQIHRARFVSKVSKAESAGHGHEEETIVWIGGRFAKNGTVTAVPSVMATLATRLLALRAAGFASPAEIAAVTGSFTWLATLRRPLMSVPVEAYRFVNRKGGPRCRRRARLWKSVSAELLMMAQLLPLAAVDMTVPDSTTVTCTDASLFGYGTVYTTVEPSTIRALLELPRSGASAAPVLGRPQWSLAFAGRFAGAKGTMCEAGSGPIAAKEFITAVMALRRTASGGSGVRRAVQITDNTVTRGILRKGRTSSPSLVPIARQAAAIQLAGALYTTVVWINTEDCPADAASRGIHLSPHARMTPTASRPDARAAGG